MSADRAVAQFVIGRTTTLLGTDVEVLGRARWRTHDGYTFHEVALRTADAERWTLEIDEGNVLLVRAVPDEGWGDPMAHPSGTKAVLDQKRWVWTPYRSTLQEVEGEYWKDLEKGDVVESRAFYAPPTVLMVSRERGEPEWEWAQGVHLPSKLVEQAFGVELPKASKLHPARPIPMSAWGRVLDKLLLAAAVVAFVSVGLLATSPKAPLIDEQMTIVEREGESFVGVFDLDAPTIVGVELAATGLSQTWAEVEVLLGPVPSETADPEDDDAETVGSFRSELSYYSGRDSDGSWTENQLGRTEGFRLGEGSWMLRLGWEIDPAQSSPIGLRARVVTGWRDIGPLMIWGVLCLFGAIGMFVYRKSRWHAVLVDAGLREESD